MKAFKFIDKELLSLKDEKGRLSIFGLAFPLFFESVASHLIGVVQSMMSARFHGGFFVLPFSVVNTTISFMYTLLTLVSTGLTIILSINLGRKKYDDCKTIIGTAFYSIFVLAVVLVACGLALTRPLLTVMGLDKPEYAVYMPYAVKYFRLRMLAFIVYTFCIVVNGTLRCYGFTKVGLYSGVTANLVAAILTYLAMYVFKMPFEIAPVIMALITVVSTVVQLSIGLFLFLKKRIQVSSKFSIAWLKGILKVGVPASVSGIAYTISTMVTAIICLSLTPDAYLAKSYVTQIVYFVYNFGHAIGQSNAIMAGRMCGMGDFDRLDRMHRQNMRIAVASNVLLSLVLALFGRRLVQVMFATNDAIAAYAAIILWIDVFVEIGRGMNHAGQFGLNATGDVKFTTVISVFSCWTMSVGLSALFVYAFRWDLYGIWIAFAIDEIFRGTMYYIRWRRGSWKKSFLRGQRTLDKAAQENDNIMHAEKKGKQIADFDQNGEAAAAVTDRTE